MKKFKILCIVLSAVLVTTILGGYLLLGKFDREQNDLLFWEELQEEEGYLPALEEMGQYKEATCKYTQFRQAFFGWSSRILTATYAEEEYQTQKAYLEERYTFETSLPRFYLEDQAKEPHFSFDGYDFSLLDFETYSLEYPKKMVFVGFSQEKNQIAFVYYYDTDLDYIPESFATFLTGDCGWEAEK